MVVDLDGTLVATDTLLESFLSALNREPVRALGALLELRSGRAALKKSLDVVGCLRVATLPYRKDVLDFLTEEKERGRRIYLVTAASQSLADRIADHLGLFVSAVGSDATINLKGTRKLEWIERNLGDTFDYVGDFASDVPIWKKARVAHIVGHSRTATQNGRLAGIKVDRAFETSRAGARPWANALRLHQWSKNLLILFPLILAQQFFNLTSAAGAFAAFVLFGMVASGTYLINDLLDLSSDRVHPNKRQRAIASG